MFPLTRPTWYLDLISLIGAALAKIRYELWWRRYRRTLPPRSTLNLRRGPIRHTQTANPRRRRCSPWI
jgi:hypothetical protein